MRTRSDKKEKLLAAAERLMLAKGYPATTVDEICAQAGVTKGSFFHYFKDKEDLGKAVLDHFAGCQFQAFESAPFHKKRDPRERVYGYVDLIIQMSQDPSAPKACLVGSFAQDLSDTHPALRAQCAKHFKYWVDGFKQELDAAKAMYAPRSTLNTASLAEHLIAVLEGALILAKAKQDWTVVADSLRHFKRYVQDLFGNHPANASRRRATR